MPIYAHYKTTLESGVTKTFGGHGNFFRLLTTTGSNQLKISFDSGVEQTIYPGMGIRRIDGKFFGDIAFTNPNASSVTLEYCIAVNAEIEDNRVSIADNISVTDISDEIETPVAITATTTAAAIASSSTQKALWLQNNGSVDVWIGDANVDGSSSRGIKLEAGKQMVIPTNGAVYHRTTASTTTLSYMRLKQS
jgi:hypothetical protein